MGIVGAPYVRSANNFFRGGLLEPFLIFTGYISSSSSFPNPLTKEEEEYYLKLYMEGDERARNILVERNLRLVAHIVKIQ